MEGATSDVNVIRGGRPTRGGDRQPPSPSMNVSSICDNCGILGHRPRDRVCPALHRECHVCRRVGHFARVCRAQQRSGGPGPAPINQLADSDDVGAENYGDDIAAHREDNNFMAFGDDVDVMFSVGEIGSALPKTSLIVNDVRINMLVDSGSTVDLIDERTLRLMRGRCPSLRLTPQSCEGLHIWESLPTSTPGTILCESVHGVDVDHGSFRGGTRQQWMHPGSTNGHDATLAEHGEEARVNKAGETPRRPSSRGGGGGGDRSHSDKSYMDSR